MKHKKSAYFPQIGQDRAKARICPQSPWIPTPPLCPQLFRSHPAGEIKAPLSPPLQHEQQEHQRNSGKAVYASLQIAVCPSSDAKLLRHLLLCQSPALP